VRRMATDVACTAETPEGFPEPPLRPFAVRQRPP
jgi:hypothetical protein